MLKQFLLQSNKWDHPIWTLYTSNKCYHFIYYYYYCCDWPYQKKWDQTVECSWTTGMKKCKTRIFFIPRIFEFKSRIWPRRSLMMWVDICSLFKQLPRDWTAGAHYNGWCYIGCCIRRHIFLSLFFCLWYLHHLGDSPTNRVVMHLLL